MATASIPNHSAGSVPLDSIAIASPPAESLLVRALVLAIVFINAADFRGDTGADDFSVHWQIFLRLGICMLAGLYGLVCLFPRTAREFFLWPGLLATAYAAINFLTLPVSVNVTYSLAALASLIGVLLFIPAAIRTLGARTFLLTVLFGLVLYIVASWLAYLFVPQIGVFKEQVTATLIVERMGGLAHPNELGLLAALAALLALGLNTREQIGTALTAIVVLLAVATLVACYSRTAMIAGCIGAVVVLRNHMLSRGNIVVFLFGLAAITLVLLAALGTGKLDWQLEDLAAKVTKSGSTSELATATGRTEIWPAAIDFIQQRPLTGYGYCTARFVMEDHSYHAHNMVLNAMLSSGILGGFIVLGMMLVLLAGVIFMPRPEIDGCVACLLVAGLVDGVLPAPSPAGVTFFWFSCLFWRQLPTFFPGEQPE